VDGYAGGDFTPSTAIGLLGTGGFYGNVKNGKTITLESGSVVACATGAEITITTRATFVNFQAPDIQGIDADGDGACDWQDFNNGTLSYKSAIAAGNGAVQVGMASIPQLATVTSVVAEVQGDPGSHSALPGSMPDLRLYRVAAYGAVTLVDNQTDTSADYTAFETGHLITLSGQSELVVNGSGNLIAMLTNEGSTNSQAGFRVYRIQVAFNLTYMVYC
jgi:hypothetical protein